MAIKNLSELKKALKGVDLDSIIAAIKDENEVEVKVPDIKVFTEDEIRSRDSEQVKAGKEIAIKELKAEVGLDYSGEGSKDPKKFIENFKLKIEKDGNISIDEKVKEKDTIITKLQANLEKATQEKEQVLKTVKESQLTTEYLQTTIERKPDHFTNDEWVSFIKMGVQIDEADGVKVAKRNGEIVRDPQTLKPLPVKDVLYGYIDEKKIGRQAAEPPPQGRGGGNGKAATTGITNMKQFIESMQTQGINPNGQKAAAALQEIVAANPSFDIKAL